MDAADIASAVSSIGGAGVVTRTALFLFSKAHQLKLAKQRRIAEQTATARSAWGNVFKTAIEAQAGVIMFMFAVTTLFIMLSPIILPVFVTDLNITVYYPKTFDFWVFKVEGLKKIEVVVANLKEDQPVRSILMLPIHFAMCSNVIGFWMTGEALKR